MNTDVSCTAIQTWLPAWMVGEAMDQDAAITAHLEMCPTCRAQRDALHPSHCAVFLSWVYADIRGALRGPIVADLAEHAHRCPACRKQERTIRAADRIIHRHLAVYRLGRPFVKTVLREWTPEKMSAPSALRHYDGFAAHIERAAFGNHLSYERLIEHFGPYCYLKTFLLTGDFQWAEETARAIFTEGLPLSCAELDSDGLLQWFNAACERGSQRHPWYDDVTVAPEVGAGLASSQKSAKLMCHRTILETIRAADAETALVFLFWYVQGWTPAEVLTVLGGEEWARYQEARALFERLSAIL